MVEVSLSSSFIKSYQRNIKSNKTLNKTFDEKLKIFLENPFDTRLKTHKLSGKLNEIWSFSINFQIRVTFYFINSNKVIFENIGSHDNVY